MKTLLFIPFLFIYSMVIGQSTKIIGTPIKIGSIEVAQFDFPEKDGFPKIMTWNEALGLNFRNTSYFVLKTRATIKSRL